VSTPRQRGGLPQEKKKNRFPGKRRGKKGSSGSRNTTTGDTPKVTKEKAPEAEKCRIKILVKERKGSKRQNGKTDIRILRRE